MSIRETNFSKSQNRKKNNELFLLAYELKKLMEDLLVKEYQPKTTTDVICCYALAKCYKTFSVIINLCKNGYYEDAQMLGRTLFDVFIVISSAFYDKTGENSERYKDFDTIMRKEIYNKIKKTEEFREYSKNVAESGEILEEVKVETEELLKKYEKDKKFYRQWYGEKGMWGLALESGRSEYYEKIYHIQSHLIHALPRTMNDYVGINEKGNIEFIINPDSKNIVIALFSAFDMSFHISKIFSENYQVNNSEAIQNLFNKWVKIAKAIDKRIDYLG